MKRNKSLGTVLRSHIADLRRCAPMLRAGGLGPTADEVEKAANELEAAMARSKATRQARRAGGRAVIGLAVRDTMKAGSA